MANINQHTREVSANIVYYGPAGSGKTASLEFIHGKLRPDLRGRLTRVPTQIDPTVVYESLPVALGEIKGMRTKFEITTVPGDPIHGTTRKTLLRNVDGIVFVADARSGQLESNAESFKDLEEILAAYGRSLADVPHIIQWNHSDADEALEEDVLNRRFNKAGISAYKTVATEGTGVLEGLTTIAKLILRRLRSSSVKPATPDTSAGEEITPAASGETGRIHARAAAPLPPDQTGDDGESFDPRPLAAEAEAEETPEPAGDDPLQPGEPLVEDDAVDTALPEALVEDLGEEIPDLDIPMEPLQDDSATGSSIDLLESDFEPLDFTTEVTTLAERGELDEEWEIVAVGAPTRLGPASFAIPLEIREGDHPAREIEITITLSGLATKRK